MNAVFGLNRGKSNGNVQARAEKLKRSTIRTKPPTKQSRNINKTKKAFKTEFAEGQSQNYSKNSKISEKEKTKTIGPIIDPLCALHGGESSFYWNGMYPHYFPTSGKDCELESFKINPNIKDKQKRNVLIFGDSLDFQPCLRQFSNDWRFLNSNKALLQTVEYVTKSELFNASLHNDNQFVNSCGPREGNLQSMVLFVNGIMKQQGGELKHNAQLKNMFVDVREQLTALDLAPTHIMFNSNLWDVLNQYNQYCFEQMVITNGNLTDRENTNCLCNSTLRDYQCKHSAAQIFQRSINLPWSSVDKITIRRNALIQTLIDLNSVFPNVLLFLRTNPPSYRIDHGNSVSQTQCNRFIRNLVLKQTVPNLKLIDFDAFIGTEAHLMTDSHHYKHGGKQWNDLLYNTILDSGFALR